MSLTHFRDHLKTFSSACNNWMSLMFQNVYGDADTGRAVSACARSDAFDVESILI